MNKTRIPKAEITGVFGAIVTRLSKKMLGEVPEALGPGAQGALRVLPPAHPEAGLEP